MSAQELDSLQLESSTQGTLLPIKAQPGSRHNEIRGVHQGRLRVCVTQVAEKGKANRAILALLAKVLSVPKSTLAIQSGEMSSLKTIEIAGLSVSDVRNRLASD